MVFIALLFLQCQVFHPNRRAKRRIPGDGGIVPQRKKWLILIVAFLSLMSEACAWVLSMETVGDSDIIALCMLIFWLRKSRRDQCCLPGETLKKRMLFQKIWHLLVKYHIQVCSTPWKRAHACKKMNSRGKNGKVTLKVKWDALEAAAESFVTRELLFLCLAR